MLYHTGDFSQIYTRFQIYDFARVSCDGSSTNQTNETTKPMKVEWPIIKENWRIKSQENTALSALYSGEKIQESKK